MPQVLYGLEVDTYSVHVHRQTYQQLAIGTHLV